MLSQRKYHRKGDKVLYMVFGCIDLMLLYSGYSSKAYNTVDKYLSPVSGNNVTILLFLFSER